MLRYGFGITGNQNIPSGRIVSQFGGDRGDTFYDIAGTNTSIVPGYRQASIGNPNLKWESNKSTNVGTDVALFEGALNVVLDVYSRVTDNLLFDPRTPATAGVAGAAAGEGAAGVAAGGAGSILPSPTPPPRTAPPSKIIAKAAGAAFG